MPNQVGKICIPKYDLRLSELDHVESDDTTSETITWVCDLASVDVAGLTSIGVNFDPTLFSFAKQVDVQAQYVPVTDRHGADASCNTSAGTVLISSPVLAGESSSVINIGSIQSADFAKLPHAEWHHHWSSENGVVPIKYMCKPSIGSYNIKELQCITVVFTKLTKETKLKTNVGCRLTYRTGPNYPTNGYKPITV